MLLQARLLWRQPGGFGSLSSAFSRLCYSHQSESMQPFQASNSPVLWSDIKLLHVCRVNLRKCYFLQALQWQSSWARVKDPSGSDEFFIQFRKRSDWPQLGSFPQRRGSIAGEVFKSIGSAHRYLRAITSYNWPPSHLTKTGTPLLLRLFELPP